MRRCTKCQNGLMERMVKPEHVEDLGGIVVKVLNAVVVQRCSSCGDELIGIPDMQGLARAAAMVRALNPVRLGGKEVRFIRRALDMTQKEFAEKMDLSHEHVSRWENDHNGVGGMSEKLMRHNVCALLQIEGVYDYDPKSIANMHFRSAPDGGLPPIEMVRVRVPHRADGEESAWSEAA
jgi:putative zinc finger/helix-turn-helix YgiT family protein